MPADGMPGGTDGVRRERVLGVVTILAIAVVVAAWQVVPLRQDPDDIAITLLTQEVGEGVGSGADVRLDGVRIGSVTSIEPVGRGNARIMLRVDKSQLFGLTDALAVDYAPANLFGISELELWRAPGGYALADNSIVDLTGPNTHRVYDATLSRLLRTTGTFTNDVLTPTFTEVVTKIAHETRAFAPLFQTIVVTAEQIAQTQHLPTAYLLGQYGATLAGLPSLANGAAQMLYSADTNDYAKSDAHLDTINAGTAMLEKQLLPEIATTLDVARPYLAADVDAVAPILDTVARTIPAPRASGASLAELLRRVGAAFHDGPDGPVLNAEVDLRGVPGLAVPLLGGVSEAPGGVR